MSGWRDVDKYLQRQTSLRIHPIASSRVDEESSGSTADLRTSLLGRRTTPTLLFSLGGGRMTSEMLIGIDVAKDELVIDSGQGLVSIGNTAEAIDAWLKTLPTMSYIGLEATGAYHQLLADRAVSLGKIVYVLNPRDMRHYALGLGRRGKTDRVDAQMIRRFITAERSHLRPSLPTRHGSAAPISFIATAPSDGR